MGQGLVMRWEPEVPGEPCLGHRKEAPAPKEWPPETVPHEQHTWRAPLSFSHPRSPWENAQGPSTGGGCEGQVPGECEGKQTDQPGPSADAQVREPSEAGVLELPEWE